MKKIIVIPTKTVPQGMAALLAFNPDLSPEENQSSMKEALSHVKTGQITFAVRDTTIDGLTIENGDFMGLEEGKIKVLDKNKVQAATKLLSKMIDEDTEILTILYGEDATNEEVEELVAFCEETFEDVEVEVHNGKQPLYSFIFSIE